ncbi:MAG TPA: hypothetical protein VF620_12310 [Allosphingosinicella sp.]
MSALKGLSAAAMSQVLVSGRLSDSVSGRGVDSAIPTLDYDPSGGGGFVAVPTRLTRHADGWFAFHLAPGAMPQPSGPAPALRLAASAPRHVDDVATFAVPPAYLALASESQPIAGHDVTIVRIAGAPFRIDLTLDPLPVALAGHVFIDGDSDQPAAGADVEIVALPGAATTTGADGAFGLLTLPVAAEVTIRITHGGDVRNHVVRPDYDQRINRAVFTTA